MMSVALAAAVAHARRGGQVAWSAGLPAARAVPVDAPGRRHDRRGFDRRRLSPQPGHLRPAKVVDAAVVVVAAFGIDAWFYVPLVLSPRSQTLFTDTEVSLSWSMLFHPFPGHLAGLTPWLVPLGLLLSGFAIWQSLPPAIPYHEKVALGRDVTILTAMTVDSVLPEAAGPGIRRYFRWFTRVQSLGLARRMALLFAVATAAVFAYGLVGLAVPHFPLRQRFAAHRPAGVSGLSAVGHRRADDGAAAAVDLVAGPGCVRAPAGQGIPHGLRIATVVAVAAVTGITIGHTAGALLPAESTNGDVPQRAALLPLTLPASTSTASPVPPTRQPVGQRLLLSAPDPRLRRPRCPAPRLAGLARDEPEKGVQLGGGAQLPAGLVRREVGRRRLGQRRPLPVRGQPGRVRATACPGAIRASTCGPSSTTKPHPSCRRPRLRRCW